jgi:hypothetical protein
MLSAALLGHANDRHDPTIILLASYLILLFKIICFEVQLEAGWWWVEKKPADEPKGRNDMSHHRCVSGKMATRMIVLNMNFHFHAMPCRKEGAEIDVLLAILLLLWGWKLFFFASRSTVA